MRLTGLQFPGSPFLPFLKIETFSSFQLAGNSPDSQDCSFQAGSHKSRVEESPPLTCWPHFFWCSPEFFLLPRLQAFHTADSRRVFINAHPKSFSTERLYYAFIMPYKYFLFKRYLNFLYFQYKILKVFY